MFINECDLDELPKYTGILDQFGSLLGCLDGTGVKVDKKTTSLLYPKSERMYRHSNQCNKDKDEMNKMKEENEMNYKQKIIELKCLDNKIKEI